MFGFNTDKVIESELSALSDDGKKFEWDWGDDIRSGLYGIAGKDYSRKTLQEAVLALQTKQINDDPTVRRDSKLAEQYKPGSSLELKRQEGETLLDLQDRALIQKSLGQGISRAKRENPGVDLGGIQSQSELDTEVSTFVKEKNRKAEEKIDGRLKDKDNLMLMQLIQQGKTSDNQFAVQMAQVDYQNRAAEMKDARLERRDRQSAIQQMMAGLATMGASIAI